ncbi:MAG: signal peptidase I [Tenuifilaceae bacterium]|jgi:ATP-binding cassette subfamily B protein|nr:signal peptidase I [Tenuifilaceae bacterium]
MPPTPLQSELLNLSGELLNDGVSLRFRMDGYSMYPTFKPGTVGVVEKCDPQSLKRGDIVVFRSNAQLIAHRLIRISQKEDKTYFIARGDRNRFYDKPCSEADLIGKIVSFSKKGKTISLSSWAFRLKSFLIMALHPMLQPLFSLALRIRIILRRVTESARSFSSNLKLIRKGSEGLMRLNIVIAVLQGILPFAVIVCLKWLIDSLSIIGSPDEGRTTAFAFILSVTALVFLLNTLVSVVRTVYFERLSFSVSMHIYSLLHGKHANLDMRYYEDSAEQDKIHRAVQEAGFRPVKILNDLLQIIRSAIAGAVIIGLFISIKWYLVLILIPALVPGILVRLKHSARLYRYKKENSTREREAYYFNRVLTALPFAKELKLFAYSQFFQHRFRATHSQLFDAKDKLNRTIMRYDIAAQTLAVITVFGLLGFIVLLALQGKSTLGTVAMAFLVFQRGYSVLGDFSRSATQLAEDNIFMNDFTGFVNLPTLSSTTIDSSFPPTLQKGITIENVTFRYKPDHRYALNGINIQIPAGKTVAFVGKNGSGKTTMIKLICGFYNPSSGSITFDDIDSRQINPADIRQNITAVFQDFALYNLSATENIALGDIHRPIDLERVREAARSAGIDSIIEQLPNGYNSLLGTQFAGGKELSIGQWQRFAIARAFYRDSPILIFDEPSSALDAESEQQVLQRLKALSHSKTVIIISHRLSTIQWADLIYVFDEGKIIHSGTYQQIAELGILQ